MIIGRWASGCQISVTASQISSAKSSSVKQKVSGDKLKLVDDFYGKQFVLLDWQHSILWDVYGTVQDEGIRQYKTAYLEIPKKNGKTSLIAAIALYHLVADGYQGQIYCCAADRGQAELVYKAACGMRAQNKSLQKILKLTDSKKEIRNVQTGTFLKVLSAEAYTKHGINPTVVIFDEYFVQKPGVKSRWMISTSGANCLSAILMMPIKIW
ncbi:hypothetical protein AXF24_12290 [Streptococcus pneumoniae]|nr:hypothetical protein AWW74_12310 [Streptococcus pneumoniae]KXB95025.1 hypothetical protein AXF24_12290 [Streptococcus pneumoniae]